MLSLRSLSLRCVMYVPGVPRAVNFALVRVQRACVRARTRSNSFLNARYTTYTTTSHFLSAVTEDSKMRSHMHITGYCAIRHTLRARKKISTNIQKYARYVGVDTFQRRLQYVY